MVDEYNGTNRRTVLKAIGTGSVTALGVTGVGSATVDSEALSEYENSVEMRQAADEFTTDADLQRAFKDHGKAVQETLAAEGISVLASLEAFDEVRSFPDRHGDIATAHIVAERDDGVRELEFHVLPQADETFAVEKTDSGLRRFEANDVKPAEYCQTSTYCEGYCSCAAPTPDCDPNCDDGYEVEERCCQYGDGSYECETLSRNCTNSCTGNECA